MLRTIYWTCNILFAIILLQLLRINELGARLVEQDIPIALFIIGICMTSVALAQKKDAKNIIFTNLYRSWVWFALITTLIILMTVVIILRPSVEGLGGIALILLGGILLLGILISIGYVMVIKTFVFLPSPNVHNVRRGLICIFMQIGILVALILLEFTQTQFCKNAVCYKFIAYRNPAVCQGRLIKECFFETARFFRDPNHCNYIFGGNMYMTTEEGTKFVTDRSELIEHCKLYATGSSVQ